MQIIIIIIIMLSYFRDFTVRQNDELWKVNSSFLLLVMDVVTHGVLFVTNWQGVL